jgi:peptide/nickel transport system substrate-binding protein
MTRLYLSAFLLGVMLFSSCSPKQTSESQPDRPKYQESPMLAEHVKKGVLPPVEERLPENPLVVEPAESIGVYDSETKKAEKNEKAP